VFKTCFIDLLIDQLIGNPVRSSSCELGTVQLVRSWDGIRQQDGQMCMCRLMACWQTWFLLKSDHYLLPPGLDKLVEKSQYVCIVKAFLAALLGW